MIVGFTGTQKGMTGAQKLRVGLMLEDTQDISFARHGDCVGADGEFDYLCGVRSINVISHPCDIPGKRAHCLKWHDALPYYLSEMQVKPPMERNQDIVDGSDVLITAPAGFEEELRSGTWSTVRKARRRGIPVFIVWPDGTFTVEIPGVERA